MTIVLSLELQPMQVAAKTRALLNEKYWWAQERTSAVAVCRGKENRLPPAYVPWLQRPMFNCNMHYEFTFTFRMQGIAQAGIWSMLVFSGFGVGWFYQHSALAARSGWKLEATCLSNELSENLYCIYQQAHLNHSNFKNSGHEIQKTWWRFT